MFSNAYLECNWFIDNELVLHIIDQDEDVKFFITALTVPRKRKHVGRSGLVVADYGKINLTMTKAIFDHEDSMPRLKKKWEAVDTSSTSSLEGNFPELIAQLCRFFQGCWQMHTTKAFSKNG